MASPPRTQPCIQRCEVADCLERCFRRRHPDDDYEDHFCSEHERDLDHNCSGEQVADTNITIFLKAKVKKDRIVLAFWLGFGLAWLGFGFGLAWLCLGSGLALALPRPGLPWLGFGSVFFFCGALALAFFSLCLALLWLWLWQF